MREVALELFDDPVWQMSRGERAAIEGLLSALRPELAIEIGSMEGACLRRVASHATEVHSFDLQPPTLEQPRNVHLHTGDSHELLPQFLAELAEQERNVDFVVVDGDHSPEGVRQDLEDLLDSPSVRHTVILIHDVANERVREGVDAVPFTAWPKVSHVELDWIPGRLFAEPALRNELWYGLGLVIVDQDRPDPHQAVYEARFHPLGPILAEVRQDVVLRELAPAGADSSAGVIDVLKRWLDELVYEISLCREREARLDGELDRLRRREAELVQAVAHNAARAEQAESAAAHMTSQWERAERALEDIKSSVSWKVTKPLRGAKRGSLGAG
jgi:hypothetical protein